MKSIENYMIEWGRWAKCNSEIDYYHIKVKLNGFIPRKNKIDSGTQQIDMIRVKAIDTAVNHIQDSNAFQIIVLRYIYGLSKRQISRMLGVTEGLIRYELKMIECFICGLLFVRFDITSIYDILLKEKKKISMRY